MLQTQPQLLSFTLLLYLMDLQSLNKTLMLEINTALDMCQITPTPYAYSLHPWVFMDKIYIGCTILGIIHQKMLM